MMIKPLEAKTVEWETTRNSAHRLCMRVYDNDEVQFDLKSPDGHNSYYSNLTREVAQEIYDFLGEYLAQPQRVKTLYCDHCEEEVYGSYGRYFHKKTGMIPCLTTRATVNGEKTCKW